MLYSSWNAGESSSRPQLGGSLKSNRVIIAGGRDFEDWELFKMKVAYYLLPLDPNDVEIVSGDATGADAFAERYAREYNYSFRKFEADWDRYGKAAGPIRNSYMAAYGTHLIDFWDDVSTGSADMIKKAKKAGLKIRIVRY